MKGYKYGFLCAVLAISLTFTGCEPSKLSDLAKSIFSQTQEELITPEDIPPFTDEPYVAINNNMPFFDGSEVTSKSYDQYSELDSLDRCGEALANIGQDILPDEEREGIGMIKPSGWHTVKYDIVDGKYLYNRCHLIGYQLSGENANELNLFTGTRYLNIKGMLPFENDIADYVKETGNHVLYRATPIYEGDNLLASGVLMEAKSVEDEGEGICFNIYAYNSQPGIEIDYATGESHLIEETAAEEDNSEKTYYLNTNTLKFHLPTCSSVEAMSNANKKKYRGSREKLMKQGYEPCGNCNP